MHAEMIGVILLFIHQPIVALRRAELMTPDLIGQQRLFMLAHVVKRA